MKKIRVLIVEDSPVVRQLLEYLIQRDPRLEVAASVGSAEEALRILHRVSPDVISMDIRLPGMNGFEATQQIMTQKPTPIVVVSASVEAEDLKISMNALRAAPWRWWKSPSGTSHENYETVAQRLCTQLAIMSQVKVIRQRIDRGLQLRPGEGDRRRRRQPRSAALPGPFRMLGVVASTGGPNALTTLLGGLPKDFPLPDPPGAAHHRQFSRRLRVLAEQRLPLAGGAGPGPGSPRCRARCTWPPADRHLRVEGGCLRLDRRRSRVQPAPLRDGAVPVDGAEPGARCAGRAADRHGRGWRRGSQGNPRGGRLHPCGGRVHGGGVTACPAAAVRLGAVCESLPLPEIAPQILSSLVSPGKEGLPDGPALTASCWSRIPRPRRSSCATSWRRRAGKCLGGHRPEGDGGDQPESSRPDPARLLPARHPRGRVVPAHPHEHQHARHPHPDDDGGGDRTPPSSMAWKAGPTTSCPNPWTPTSCCCASGPC